MQPNAIGLRERRHLDTLRVLHEAAVQLVLEGGLAGATADAIADRAGASRRTFFNYYASKEDAVLGTTPPVISEEALKAFADTSTGTDQFTRTVRLLVAVVRSMRQPSGGVPGMRLSMVRQFPDLRARLLQHITAAERLVETTLAEHARSADPPRSPDSARAVVMLAGTVLRYASTIDPEATESEREDAVDSAISVFRAALKEIA